MNPHGSRARVSVLLSMAMLVLGGGYVAVAQQPERTVADGVFTEAQAVRGSAAYDASCSGCHRPNLTGADGPALRDERFTKNFANQDLKVLYTKIATTMPRNAAGSLGDNVYVDIVAHLLRENGFPAGENELTTDTLAGVRILPGRPKPPPPVADFSYVDVVGCLAGGADTEWTLANAGEPTSVVVAPESAPKMAEDAGSRSLGSRTFHLLDAMAYNPEKYKGHRIYVRGLLIKLPSEYRLTISALESLSPTCGT